jgi:hypothetical protein
MVASFFIHDAGKDLCSPKYLEKLNKTSSVEPFEFLKEKSDAWVKWENFDRKELSKEETTNWMRPWLYQTCSEFGWF